MNRAVFFRRGRCCFLVVVVVLWVSFVRLAAAPLVRALAGGPRSDLLELVGAGSVEDGGGGVRDPGRLTESQASWYPLFPSLLARVKRESRGW